MASKKFIVLDTNVFVSALRSGGGASRDVLRLAFQDHFVPLMGDALFLEYQDLLQRDDLFQDTLLPKEVREALFDDLCAISHWVEIHYRWRPNLRDEADNHVLELAIAGGAKALVTWNIKDFKGGDLVLPDFDILTPVGFLPLLNKASSSDPFKIP